MNNSDVSHYLAINTAIRNAKLKGLNADRFNYKTNRVGIFSVNASDNDTVTVAAQFDSNGIDNFDTLHSNNKFISRAMDDFKRRVSKIAAFPVVKVDYRNEKEEFIDIFNNESIKVSIIIGYKSRRFNNLSISVNMSNFGYFFIYNGKKVECRHFTFYYDSRGLFISQTNSLDILINDFDRSYPGSSLERNSIIAIREMNSMLYL